MDAPGDQFDGEWVEVQFRDEGVHCRGPVQITEGVEDISCAILRGG